MSEKIGRLGPGPRVGRENLQESNVLRDNFFFHDQKRDMASSVT